MVAADQGSQDVSPSPGGKPASDTQGATVPDTSSSAPDSIVAVMLEKARQHYLSATAAQGNGDSARSASQFEEAIAILDELSYIPGIDENRDFNDLTKAVVEDYEQYIAVIDSLDPRSSIFALRAKLNQVTEGLDTLEATPPTRVVSGTTIPLVINNLVEKNISFFQGRGRPHMERWLEVAGKYFPRMREIIREERAPEEERGRQKQGAGANGHRPSKRIDRERRHQIEHDNRDDTRQTVHRRPDFPFESIRAAHRRVSLNG